MHALVARRDDASARVRGAAFPGGDDASSADDDRHEGKHVVRLELRLDYQIDVARRQHAIGVAIPSIAREPHGSLNPPENFAIARIHQQRAGREQNRAGEIGACAHPQVSLSVRTAIMRASAVAAEPLASERLIHHTERRHIAPLPRTANPLRCPIWHRGIAFKDWGALTFLVSTRSPAGRRKALPLHCGKATYAQQTVIPTRFPLAICALHCMLLRCGSAWRYRRPPWAFPP